MCEGITWTKISAEAKGEEYEASLDPKHFNKPGWRGLCYRLMRDGGCECWIVRFTHPAPEAWIESYWLDPGKPAAEVQDHIELRLATYGRRRSEPLAAAA